MCINKLCLSVEYWHQIFTETLRNKSLKRICQQLSLIMHPEMSHIFKSQRSGIIKTQSRMYLLDRKQTNKQNKTKSTTDQSNKQTNQNHQALKDIE